MSRLFTTSRGRPSRAAEDQDEVSMPLRSMIADAAPLNDSGKEVDDDDGIDDFDPLLASAEGTLERVKAEIEYELGSSRADNSYESKCVR